MQDIAEISKAAETLGWRDIARAKTLCDRSAAAGEKYKQEKSVAPGEGDNYARLAVENAKLRWQMVTRILSSIVSHGYAEPRNEDSGIASEIRESFDDIAGPDECQSCARAFETLCPQACSLLRAPGHSASMRLQGWSTFYGGMCIAPNEYGGPCPPTSYFNAFSVADKQAYERRCKVCWPCEGSGSEIGAKPAETPSGPIG